MTRLEAMRLVGEGKVKEAEEVWRGMPDPKPRFPVLSRDTVELKTDFVGIKHARRTTGKAHA